ncbi:hypothetical protein CEE39_09050 [bacterium (candidate division B38) B3_B38]|nr:MAG: hypothetical protein CEE39_09050 [bacterium (candidate division B38) B3_B38]
MPKEYTIYAVKVIQPWEEDSSYWIPLIYEEIKQGRARFGWGYYDEADVRKIKEKADRQEWKHLDKKEISTWSHAGFLLNIIPEDYFIYINMPEYGKCSIVKITGDYNYSEVWDKDKKEDFRHFLPCEFIYTFDRNSDIVHPYLRRRLGLQGAWYRIYAKKEFEELLVVLHKEDEGKKAKDRLEEEINPRLLEISQKVSRTFPGKNLENLLLDVFKKVPNIKDARKGPDVNGADLEVEFESGLDISGLQKIEVCAVQVKSYEGEMSNTDAIEDIKRAFNSNMSYTCGFIVSTASEMTEDFEKELDTNEWRQLATDFVELCKEHKLVIDPAVPLDSARILRIPGTTHQSTETFVSNIVVGEVNSFDTYRKIF